MAKFTTGLAIECAPCVECLKGVDSPHPRMAAYGLLCASCRTRVFPLMTTHAPEADFALATLGGSVAWQLKVLNNCHLGLPKGFPEKGTHLNAHLAQHTSCTKRAELCNTCIHSKMPTHQHKYVQHKGHTPYHQGRGWEDGG